MWQRLEIIGFKTLNFNLREFLYNSFSILSSVDFLQKRGITKNLINQKILSTKKGDKNSDRHP